MNNKIKLADDHKYFYDVINANPDFGFFHVVTSDELTIQCCYNADNDTIDVNDSGINDGICGDVNEAAFKKYGSTECQTFLFNEAKKYGLKLI